MSLISKEKILLIGKMLFPIILLVLISFELKHVIMSINKPLLLTYIKSLSLWNFVIIILGGFFAIAPMFFYDRILLKYLQLKIPMRNLCRYSLISNSFSNLLGFGGLIGISLRNYFYQTYENDKKRLFKGIATVSLFYLSGISFLALFILFGNVHIPLLQNHKWLFFAVWIVGLYFPVLLLYLFLKKPKGKDLTMSKQVGFSLFFASLFEWLFIFFYLLTLTKILSINVSFIEFFHIFIIACCAGIISMIPGGLGSFDLVFIWGFHEIGSSDEKILILLILYRIGYLMIPFIIGFFSFLHQYWSKWNDSWSHIPNMVIEKISHLILTILVFLSGLVLLISAALPGILERLKFTEEILSMHVMNLSHQVSVGTGFVLLGLSRGIENKEKRAYHLTIIILLFAAISTFLKGMDYEEALFILIVAFLLRLAKNRFYRKSFVITWGKALFDTSLILIITSAYLIIGYVSLPTSKLNVPTVLLPYIILDPDDLFFSAAIGLIIAFLIFLFGYILGKPKSIPTIPSDEQELEIKEFLKKYRGSSLSHLIFLHDKSIFWNHHKNVLCTYKTYANKMVILGDPIGEEQEIFNSIEEILIKADQYGYTPIYYQVSKEMLPFLHANGFDFFKLGEEAYVYLEEFSLNGKKKKNSRAMKNKFEREGYTFSISSPPHSSELFSRLKFISTEWLQGRSEKGFSLGFYSKAYLNQSPIALVKDGAGDIIAFASVMPMYDQDQMISVDLMRRLPSTPSGTMDFLFLNLFEASKEKGYKYFNLGMAPLSNVGTSKFSFLSEKIAAQIYLRGYSFYHFQGIRLFKEKYADHWEPKYLAFRKKSSLPFTMAQVSMMISKRK
ncbi:bifunctional lysylphosphatidylglycerol flippase/synthetase MprF [Bacillus sp. 03113]|uniref:bifunctional lysylphosphatidylglycerol flippase/synthetase MprF n=1 Tax=Bacillus sp. 03113 TaxID=2578211 RepID=UPI001143FED2|nr:bifunctional lysylphosphatidylglycerol flippase/synthetase MprF [Bacillus sp. 03113]